MRGRSIARRYAEGLMDSAKKMGRVEEFATELATINSILLTSPPDVEKYLSHPQVERSSKQKLLEKLAGEKISEEMIRLTALLLKRGRLQFFQMIEQEYLLIKRSSEGFRTIIVESKRELGKKEKKKLVAALERAIDGKVILDNRIDTGIIGGIRVRTESKMIDGTINGQLETMREKLIDHISEDRG